ncbi:MAG: hypothetical protein ACYDER_23925 [Ktedonobacteraceae bacterium]
MDAFALQITFGLTLIFTSMPIGNGAAIILLSCQKMGQAEAEKSDTARYKQIQRRGGIIQVAAGLTVFLLATLISNSISEHLFNVFMEALTLSAILLSPILTCTNFLMYTRSKKYEMK